MRRTINISVPEELHDYIIERSRYTTVSEYIRMLVRGDRQRRADDANRPAGLPLRANDSYVLANALEQLDKVKSILERNDPYDV